MTKTIEYYRKDNYGVTREYVINEGDAKILKQLTGKLTIDGPIRELVRDLTGGTVTFKETTNPFWNVIDLKRG